MTAWLLWTAAALWVAVLFVTFIDLSIRILLVPGPTEPLPPVGTYEWAALCYQRSHSMTAAELEAELDRINMLALKSREGEPA